MNRKTLIALLLAACAQTAAAETDDRTSQAGRAEKVRPLGLEQVLELAFRLNPDLQAAQERIGQAEAKVAEAAAAFYPKVTGRLGYNYSNDPSMAFSYIVAQRRFSFGQNINRPGFVENFRPELVGQMSLFRGGQDYYRKKAAELGVEAATLEREALHNRLAASVTAAYYAMLAAPKQLEAARRSVEAVESELKNARIQYEEGALLKADVLSLEVRRAQAKETELKAQNAVELTLSGLKTLLGQDGEESLALREANELPADRPETLADSLRRALTQRPEMQAAARQIEMRERELRAEMGGHLPRVNAYAAYGINERSPEFDFSRDNLTLGLSAEVDLFAGGAVSARVRGAERKLAEARAVRERTRLDIEDEVRKARANLDEARERRQVAEAAQEAANEALRLVREQFRAGATTVTRYLEAEADRAQSEIRAVTARYDAQIAQAFLRQATGDWLASMTSVQGGPE